VSKVTKRHCAGTVQSQGGRVWNVSWVLSRDRKIKLIPYSIHAWVLIWVSRQSGCELGNFCREINSDIWKVKKKFLSLQCTDLNTSHSSMVTLNSASTIRLSDYIG